MSQPKLLPCPFCGSRPIEHLYFGGGWWGHYACPKNRCRCEQSNFVTKEEAREAWNTRTAVDELVHALRWLLDNQNGAPLPSYERDWNYAISLAAAALDKYEGTDEDVRRREEMFDKNKPELDNFDRFGHPKTEK